MRKTKLNKKITKHQKLWNMRLEPESKAYEKLLYNKDKKMIFPTVHHLLKQEEYTEIEKFNIWAKYFSFFFLFVCLFNEYHKLELLKVTLD